MKPFVLSLLLICYHSLSAQNLPSLISGKNINATFSIAAYDPDAKEWGIAVATNNIYVGNSTVYIQPGLGAFSVIAETDPAYAQNGFEQLRQGKTIREAIEFTRRGDASAYLRQVSGIDAHGNCFAYTGSTWKYQKGFAGSLTGNGYVVMGNQLGDSVLQDMSATFQRSAGTLAQRLLAALIAGEKAGGQVSGKQSAALAVKGTGNEWFNNIDLRVDDSKDPFNDLQRLLNYHYGRIELTQSIMAIQMGNIKRGENLLGAAEGMTRGWNGLQSRIALAYLLLHMEPKAVAVIRAALNANPKFKENLPAFDLLKDQPGMEGLIDENAFSEKDWISAVSLMDELNRQAEAYSLSQKAMQRFPMSSYLHYLSGKAVLATGKKADAKKDLQEAVRLDPSNDEAVDLLHHVVATAPY